MGIYNNTAEVDIRERRLSSVLSAHGTLDDIVTKSGCKSLCTSCNDYEQCGTCAQENAMTITMWVRDAALISHAPIGCSLDSIVYEGNATVELKDQERQVWYVASNIQERDTIYGASKKLNTAIDTAYERYKPRVIFILASCVTGIIGEDLESSAENKEAEYGIPIVPIYCEGFKSRMWSSGFDAGYHGILRKLIKKPEKKQKDLVNIFNFIGEDRLKELLAKAGIRTKYGTPFATLEDLQELAEASCSATFCETLSSYATAALEESYGVNQVKNPPPYGIKWTDDWLREIGTYTGKEQEIEEVIKSEHERIQPELEELRAKLKGKKVYVMTGDTFAFQMANVVGDLGMEVVGISPLHHDQNSDGEGVITSLEKLNKDKPGIDNVNVCSKQPYQAIKLIRKADPDSVICRHAGIAAIATKMGISILPEGNKDDSIAYEGVLKLGHRALVALKTQKLVKHIGDHVKFPYTDWWTNDVDDAYYFAPKK